MLQPGTQIGRYEIQRKLARGGMGVVYVAHDPVLGRMVAVKVFLGDLDVPDAAERFAREARAAASLNHANIVTVYDFGEVASQPYIVMEYIQGDTIAEIIRRRTPVPIPEKIRWLEEVCAGAASAHKMDVIHRDLKPSNLMIDRAGRLKILDFGIAKIVNSLATSMTAVIGTPGYMAPEQLLGHPVDARTDVFAIGVVGFELLTYEEAFAGDSFTAVTQRIVNENVRPISEIVPDAPPELCALIDKALSKRPADRFQDAESMRKALARVRRTFETSSDLDPSAAATIIGTIAAPGRRVGARTSSTPSVARVRTAELTPPPDPVAQREAMERARAAQIQAQVDLAHTCLQQGDMDRAMEACTEALSIDSTHAGALALQQTISATMARQRAAALLADARGELGRGALTRCQALLDEARHLDPAGRDTKLERELRMARVEQERLRHRAETQSKTVASAREALDNGDVEAALAWAREALDLESSSEEARAIEAEALHRLEQTADVAPEHAPVEPPSLDEITHPTGPRRTHPPIPAAGAAVPARERVTPSPATGAPPRAAPVHVPPPLAPTRPDPMARLRTIGASMPRPNVQALRSASDAVVARVRGIPRRHLQILGGAILGLVLVGAALVAYLLRSPAGPPPMGILVIEAVPWAEITAITSSDGTNRLATPTSTPLSQSLPVGTYTVELSGPPPDAEKRQITIEVGAAGVTLAPAERFGVPTVEQYFGRYFGGSPEPSAPAPPPAAPEPTTTPPPAGAIP